MNRPLWTPPSPRAGLVYVSAMVTAIAVLYIAAVVGVFTDRAQNKEQDRLLACFDKYASSSSEASKEIRVASASVSEAQSNEARKSVVWTNLLVRGLSLEGEDGTPEARKIIFQFATATTELRKAQSALVDAQVQLADVRAENPVPDPPSQFCNE